MLALVGLTLAAFPEGERYRYAFEVGDEWRQETLIAPFDFAILKDQETVARERREIRAQTPPLFEFIPGAQEQMRANRDTLEAQLARIFDLHGRYQTNVMRARWEDARRDSVAMEGLRRTARLKATPAQWKRLLDAYTERVPGLVSSSRAVNTSPRLDKILLEEAYEYGQQVLMLGVLNVPVDSILTDQIVIRDKRQRTDILKPKNRVFGLDEAYQAAQKEFQNKHLDDPELASLAWAFFRALFQPSLRYMRAETLQEWQRKEEAISLTRGVVHRGEVVVNQGEIVTPEIERKLRSLERKQDELSGARLPWKITLAQILLTLATYSFFFLYLYILRRPIFDDNRKILLVAILFAGITGLFAIALRLPDVSLYAVPVVIVSLVLTILFDSRVSLFGTVALAFIGSHLLRFDFEFTFATVFAGALGIFSVRDIKNRGQFFVSAGLVFIGYLVVLVASWLLKGTPIERFGMDVLQVGINSFLLIMALPLLWVFERAFNMTTDLTLLELSDTNRPLLKELSLRAPGTFNHSLQVANLAEAAADAIGANALLTRVGALYHDVGKMGKPEYFVENQRPGENPHDQLKPRMSALIIASHVKEGLEIAREYKLPDLVLDFIPMHHGTTRIEFFYRRAQEQASPDDPPIMESEFRYPGPKPNTKETSILMLADSVEAASRSLGNPTHKRLEGLIDMLITARREDGQLDDSELTFRDLRQIKETFLSMLLAIYHVRVKYPEPVVEGTKEGRGGEKSGEVGSQDALPAAATPVDEKVKEPEKAVVTVPTLGPGQTPAENAGEG